MQPSELDGVTGLGPGGVLLVNGQSATSAGAPYIWDGTRLSTDLVIGTGLRQDGAIPSGSHLPASVQVNLGANHEFDLNSAGKLTLRFDIINVFNAKYEIRNGTGIGVGAPQWGARRGFFAGVTEDV